jgi:hypothetical protein
MEAAVAELSDLVGEPVWAELTLGLARTLFNADDKPAALRAGRDGAPYG